MKAIRLYAQVLVDVLSSPEASSSLDRVVQELKDYVKMFAENSGGSAMMLQVFDNPTLGDDEKQKALKELETRIKLAPLTARFISILVKRNRLGLLADIIHKVETILVEKKGGLIGELTSAIPIDESVTAGVAEALSKKFKKPVQLKQKVDPGIIAGMRVTIAGVTYDGSVKGRLDKLTQNFH